MMLLLMMMIWRCTKVEQKIKVERNPWIELWIKLWIELWSTPLHSLKQRGSCTFPFAHFLFHISSSTFPLPHIRFRIFPSTFPLPHLLLRLLLRSSSDDGLSFDLPPSVRKKHGSIQGSIRASISWLEWRQRSSNPWINLWIGRPTSPPDLKTLGKQKRSTADPCTKVECTKVERDIN